MATGAKEPRQLLPDAKPRPTDCIPPLQISRCNPSPSNNLKASHENNLTKERTPSIRCFPYLFMRCCCCCCCNPGSNLHDRPILFSPTAQQPTDNQTFHLQSNNHDDLI